MVYEENDNWIHFGDLNLAQVFDFRTFIDDETGLEYIEFYFRPSSRLVNKYPHIIDEVDEEGMLYRTFSTSEVITVPGGINRTRWLVFKDVENKDTEVSNYFTHTSTVIDDLKRLLKTEKYAKYVALQELSEERTQKEVSIKQQSKLIKAVAEARGRVDQEEVISDENDY